MKLTDTEIWRKPLNCHFAAPKIKRTEVLQLYIHFSLCCHNQSPSHQKQLAWLLIITSRRKVWVLGFVIRSILKNMHLTTAKHPCDHYSKMYLFLKRGYTGGAWLFIWQERCISDQGRGWLFMLLSEKISMFIITNIEEDNHRRHSSFYWCSSSLHQYWY